MSDTTEAQTSSETDSPALDERTLTMQRARLMGITFSNNISLEKLKAKVAEHLASEEKKAAEPESEDDAETKEPTAPAAMTSPKKKQTEQELRNELTLEAMKLVRIRLTCFNPAKKDLPGEIFTIANGYIGTVRKYIPFTGTDEGYHVPHCIYEMLRDRQFLHIRTVGKAGQEHVKTSYEKEFAIEVLPPLTAKELKELAIKQAAANGEVSDEE